MFQLKASDIGQHFWDKHISLERDRGLLMS